MTCLLLIVALCCPLAVLAQGALQRYEAEDYRAAARLGLRELADAPKGAKTDELRLAVANSLAWTGQYDPAIEQYKALLGTEGIDLEFTDDAIDSIANFAFKVNETTEDIGARRLQTILEKVLDEISFEGPDLVEKHQVIDSAYVNSMLAAIVKNEDLSRYIL